LVKIVQVNTLARTYYIEFRYLILFAIGTNIMCRKAVDYDSNIDDIEWEEEEDNSGDDFADSLWHMGTKDKRDATKLRSIDVAGC
jgi:hypothetical protein